MLTLVGTHLSPYAVRVLLAARFKGIELRLEAPPEGADGARPQRSPIGRIPVLIDATLVLPESDVIVSYLEDRWPEPSLFPGSAAQRANIRLLVRILDTYSTPSFGAFISGTDAEAITVAVERIDRALGYIEHFRMDGEHAVVDLFSAADCALIPAFCIYEMLPRKHGVLELVERRRKLAAWWRRARATELGSFARDAMGKAARALRGP